MIRLEYVSVSDRKDGSKVVRLNRGPAALFTSWGGGFSGILLCVLAIGLIALPFAAEVSISNAILFSVLFCTPAIAAAFQSIELTEDGLEWTSLFLRRRKVTSKDQSLSALSG